MVQVQFARAAGHCHIGGDGSWVFYVALPRWRIYREQTDFERALNQLRRGDAFTTISEVLGTNHLRYSPRDDWRRNLSCGVMCYTLPREWYFIYYDIGKPGLIEGGPVQKIEVFRMRHPSVNTPLTSTIALTAVSDDDLVDELSMLISADRKNNAGFEYELMYSDPPEKPMR